MPAKKSETKKVEPKSKGVKLTRRGKNATVPQSAVKAFKANGWTEVE